MINVTYNRAKHSLTVKGHAGGKKGNDIVCAAVSILVFTLAEDVDRMSSWEPDMFSHMLLRLEPGDTEISLSPSQCRENITAMVFDAICTGFDLLSETHPQKIQFKRI